jgi:flagellar biosynthetic protein FliP
MAAVMVVGMVGAAALYMTIVNLMVGPTTWEEALIRYPVQSLLVVAVGMSLPMVPWMRRRGHSSKSSWEMAAAMALPVIPFACLAWFGVVEGAQCGLYCAVGFVAMLTLMLYRRAEYTGAMA